MATPGELVATMAEALGVPAKTIVVHDRNLVVAGLRSKSGRGRGAAHVCARDAAHLLTAILGSGLVRESVETVKRYAETVLHRDTSTSGGFRGTGIKSLAKLPAGHSFVDAVEALFASAAEGEIAEEASRRIGATGSGTVVVPGLIEIAVMTPRTVGEIRLAGLDDAKTVSVRYALTQRQSPAALMKSAAQRKAAAKADLIDLEQIRRVSGKTVFAIGSLIGGQGKDA